jgi:prepilin-type N-terminal cleavage/methylation domain-containing protein
MRQAVGDSVRCQRGVSLVELTVTMALFGMIMVGVMGVWQKTQESYFIGSDTAEIQQNVRSAIDFMVRELRATGRDVTVCAFNYAGDPVLACGVTKAATCLAKVGGLYAGCAGNFAIPTATANSIRILSDRNDNGTIAITGNGDSVDEDVTYALSNAAPCPAGESCIVRTAGGTTTAMVAVDISGLTFTYYPRPGYPPCAAVPPQNPCPSFVPASQLDLDNIGRVGISVTAQATIGGQTVLRTLTTDVTLKNRY